MMQTVAGERRQELACSLRGDKYELERLSMQVMTLSRKIEGDREILNMFSRAPEFIKAKAKRTFVEMKRLVPSCYSHINVVEKSILAETYPITLEHDGGNYNFEPYVVEIDLATIPVIHFRRSRSGILAGLKTMTMNRIVLGAMTMGTIFRIAKAAGGASTVNNTMITMKKIALIDAKVHETTLTNPRFLRQQDVVDAERLANLQVTLIGLGSIGSVAGLYLAKMGVCKLTTFDADV